MDHVCRRLRRPVPGEHLLGLTALVARLDARGRWQDPTPPVPDRSTYGRILRFRDVRRKVEPQPNAPLLIRIVKFPYAMHPDACMRIKLRKPYKTSPRIPFESIRRLSRLAASRLPSISPAGTRQRVGRRIPERHMVEKLLMEGAIIGGKGLADD